MAGFHYKKNRWYADGVALPRIAEKTGTPCYVYSLPAFEERFREIDRAFKSVPHLVAYSLKANANLSAVRSLARLGAGADVVSGGELFKARKAGIPANRIIYAGVGKTDEEIKYALREGIRYFNAESIPEILAINDIAKKMGKLAPVALRINPDIDADTHHHITTGKKENKFGIHLADVPKVMKILRQCGSVQCTALHVHIGSQITSPGPYELAARVLEKLAVQMRREGFAIHTVNIGGGFGIDYTGNQQPKASVFASRIMPAVKRLNTSLILEPGRFISGNSGVLLTRALFVKKSGTKTFCIVDAGMGELLRPFLYDAYHRIAPAEGPQKPVKSVDVVGPYCESTDFFAKGRRLPEVKRGDLLVVFTAGAYGSVMSSNYNAKPFSPEVAVRGNRFAVARKRQTWQDLVRLERLAD